MMNLKDQNIRGYFKISLESNKIPMIMVTKSKKKNIININKNINHI